jgi:hypothetical protein
VGDLAPDIRAKNLYASGLQQSHLVLEMFFARPQQMEARDKVLHQSCTLSLGQR